MLYPHIYKSNCRWCKIIMKCKRMTAAKFWAVIPVEEGDNVFEEGSKMGIRYIGNALPGMLSFTHFI